VFSCVKVKVIALSVCHCGLAVMQTLDE